MAHLIIKPKKDADLYVVWSTNTDSVTDVGTRRYMLMKYANMAEMTMADINGSTAQADYKLGHWDDAGFVVRWGIKAEREMHAKWLPRSKMYDWVVNEDDSLLEEIEY